MRQEPVGTRTKNRDIAIEGTIYFIKSKLPELQERDIWLDVEQIATVMGVMSSTGADRTFYADVAKASKTPDEVIELTNRRLPRPAGTLTVEIHTDGEG